MKKLEKCIIAYECWQMQCCGDPIKVGEEVNLEIETYTEPYELAGFHIDFNEEHHHGMTAVAKGTVKQIKVLFEEEYANSEHRVDDPNNGFSVYDLDYADGWEGIDKCGKHTPSDFFYYLIFMENVSIEDLV